MAMIDADAVEALLDLVDPDRRDDVNRTGRLIVLGLAERQGRTIRPTRAGWFLMGEAGRPFDLDGDRLAF